MKSSTFELGLSEFKIIALETTLAFDFNFTCITVKFFVLSIIQVVLGLFTDQDVYKPTEKTDIFSFIQL